MPAILKLGYQGEVRRAMMEKDVSYEHVLGAIAEAWPEVKDLTAKYTDEEGDLCVFCEASFTDFLAVSASKAPEKAAGQLLLRLEFVAAEPAPAKTSCHNDAATSRNLSMLGDQGQTQSFQWHPPQHWRPAAHGHGADSWDSQHGYPGFHGYGRHGHGRALFKKQGHGWQERVGWDGKQDHPDEGKWSNQKQEKKMLWLSAQRSAAVSLFVHLLPEAVQVLAVAPDTVVHTAIHKLRKKTPYVKAVLQSVMAATKQIEGLEQCEAILMQLLSIKDTRNPKVGKVARELLVSLLSAVDALSCERKEKFFETLFELQKGSHHKLLEWLLKPRKLLWLMTQLHASGALSSSIAVRLCVNLLPEAVKVLAVAPEKVVHIVIHKLRKRMPYVKAVLQNVRAAAKQIEGLEQCETILMQLLSVKDTRDPEAGKVARELLVSLLSAVDALSCEQKEKFFEALFELQKDSFHKLLDKGQGKCKRSAWDVDPEARVSKSTRVKKCARADCNFQCTWHATHCCAACANAGNAGPVHGGRCESKLMPTPTMSDAQETFDGCKTPGCNFKRTWHPTHCCGACAKHGLGKHGAKCDRKCLPFVIATPIIVDGMPSAPPLKLGEEEMVLKAKKLEEMGLGDASDMAELLKQCGGNLSKALEAFKI